MYPFVRPNPLQELMQTLSSGQEPPLGGGGGYGSPQILTGAAPPTNRLAQLEAVLSRPQPFERQEEQPEATTGRKVLAALKDAIAGYVEGRTGRAPSYAGAQDRIRAVRERNKQIREQNRLGEARAAAEADRSSALLEYQRLQKEKEQAAEETRSLRTAALGLGIDPGSMTEPQLRSAIAGGAEKKNLKDRQKEGRELLQAIAETGTEVPEETGGLLLAGDPDAIAKAYRGLGLATNARLQEKYRNERELAELRGEIDIKKKGAPSAPKPEDTAKNRVKWQKKAEEVMKGLAGYVGGFKGELNAGKITSDEIRTQLQAALDSRGLDAESAVADPVVAEERQRVINYFTRHFGPTLKEYDARVRVGG